MIIDYFNSCINIQIIGSPVEENTSRTSQETRRTKDDLTDETRMS